MEQLSEALPSDPVLLTLDLLTSEGLMLFKLGHNTTKYRINQHPIHSNTAKKKIMVESQITELPGKTKLESLILPLSPTPGQPMLKQRVQPEPV